MMAAATRRCPICGKAATDKARPFCSERCKDVDLNRWLSGRYVVPAASAEDDDSERPPSVIPDDDQ
jgi:endogenous inhibitor of DNA gyrase (YacG/DUF329 family)